MKLLRDILYKVRLESVKGATDMAIESITFDSRQVSKGTLFIAVKGTQVDGHNFIQQAIDKGAVAIVYEKLSDDFKSSDDYTLIKVNDSSEALSFIAGNFYDNPSEKLKLVGITGTNGKTTVATLSYRLFRELGFKCGLLSTVQNEIDGTVIPSTHTTPDAIQINALLAKMVDAGCTHCFMEASSHAIHQNRVHALDFKVAVFTNITHDHLDYHETFDNYIKAKKKLFDDLPAEAFALVNIDDKRGMVMVQNTRAKVKTFSLKSISDFKVVILENSFNGLVLNIDGHELYTRLVGEFNAYNLLSIYVIAVLLGIEPIDALAALSKLPAAEGRFDYILSKEEKIVGIVDYAHTPDALKNVLSTIKAIRTGNEKVITVVGCGGNRDKTKRPEMARIACELSNQVILTSDNPRNEKPEDIIEEMKKGVDPLHYKKVLSITDRKEAIKTACTMAQKQDIILLAGKGHEKYQEISGVKYDFDDKKILNQTLIELEK
jgi:UDP-N-acetylmuramoyl-L-alanyl-D-glutamate--2,6-diaminopimelate ligase